MCFTVGACEGLLRSPTRLSRGLKIVYGLCSLAGSALGFGDTEGPLTLWWGRFLGSYK